ncbi:Oxidoreductase domain protein [Burkholderiales bacterium 8X]|nr:Oxidoreductase domain protein [Burkholderiales bacterium 8X]
MSALEYSTALREPVAEPRRASVDASAAASARPRLGFLGAGWIGRHRLMAIASSGLAEPVAVSDPSAEALAEIQGQLPGIAAADSLDALFAHELDGLVIATPSALHAAQAEAALERGIAVFCQKPLARNRAETARVLDAARRADLLLGVDLSYRHTAAARCIQQLISTGELGEVYAVDLVFHNAYGPDKAWFRDPKLSGGGCVIDLGIHMVDLALWMLGFPEVRTTSGRLWSKGRRLAPGSAEAAAEVEDFATAEIELANGTMLRLACSWNLPAGRDAVIEAQFHGTRAGAAMRNLGGSFYDFAAERYDGTRTTRLVEPPDDWGGRAAVSWAERLASRPGFDPEIDSALQVAAVLDAIYGRG